MPEAPRPQVEQLLAQLREGTHSLETLPLDGVPPALGVVHWE